MATAMQVDDIKCITKVDLNVNSTELEYTINKTDGVEDVQIPAKEIDTDQLNSAEFSQLIQNIPGMPNSLRSHEELENFLKENFLCRKKVPMDIVINENIGSSYYSFPIVPSYITGIPIACIVESVLDYYSGGNVVLKDDEKIPSESEVNLCLHINLC